MHNNEIRRKIATVLRFFDRFLPLIFWLLVVFGFQDPLMGALTLLAAVIHESGHVCALYILKGIISLPFGVLNGVRLSSRSLLSYKEDLILFSAGPFSNLIVSLFALPFLGRSLGYAENFIIINLTTALTNLLPIRGYDGYGILRSIGGLFSKKIRFENILSSVSSLLTALLTFVSLYLMYVFGTGYWIYAVFFLSVYSSVERGTKSHFFEF